MAYSYLTFGQMQTLLANRLGDPGGVFYGADEKRAYLREALRCWNSASLWFRGRFTFDLTVGVRFYDLGTVVSTLIPRTVTDQQIVNDVQYALMEPANDWSSSVTWGGSEQFTMADVVGAVQRRRDQFLLETATVLTNSEFAVSPAPASRIALNDDVIDVRRAAWKTPAVLDNPSRYHVLWRSNERAMNSLAVGWSVNQNLPQVFSTVIEPPLTLQLAPISNNVGSLNLITLNAGATLDVTQGIALGVPDDFAWVIKFGALADLLGRDGQARDAERAQYCESRYQEGVQLARIAASVMNVEIDGRQATISALQSLDSIKPDWMNTGGAPREMAMAGLNLAAFAPPALLTPYAALVDVVRNAPMPASDGANIQVGREQLDCIISYAVSLACFKEQGTEWQGSLQGYVDMMRLAADNNSRLKACAQQFDVLRDPSVREFRRRPMREEDAA